MADGYHLWSERYEREMEDVFAIQDDISQAIAKSLRVILTAGEKAAIEMPRTINVEAYDYYLRGRQFFHLHRRKSLEYAVQMYEKAVEIDPDYALAYAEIALASSLLYTWFDSRETNLIQAEFASRKALELAPQLAEAHLARGIALWLGEKGEEAETEYEAATTLDPKLFEAFYFYGRMRRAQGNHAEAITLLSRASQLRPEDFQAPAFLGGEYAVVRGGGRGGEFGGALLLRLIKIGNAEHLFGRSFTVSGAQPGTYQFAANSGSSTKSVAYRIDFTLCPRGGRNVQGC